MPKIPKRDKSGKKKKKTAATSTCVVNVKVAHIRPAYQNLAMWMKDPRNVYIGRRGVVFIDGRRFPAADSMFANPFKIGKVHGSRENVVKAFAVHFRARLQSEPGLVAALQRLRGKRLGCWCAPAACHGHVLLELLEELDPREVSMMPPKEESGEEGERPKKKKETHQQCRRRRRADSSS